MGKYPMKRCDPVETWPEADIVGEIERDLETGRDPMIEEIAVVHAITDEFHLKGTEYDHDQQTHAGGGGSGAVTADFAEAPPGYTEEAQKAWRIGYEYLSNHEMPDWWNGTEVMDDDGLPKRENQVAHDWDRPGVGDEIDAWKETVGDDVEHGVWMIGRAAESLRRQRIQESIAMNEIDLAAAEERWGKYRIEPGGNGSAQWEDLPPVLYHATSALSAIAESGVLKTRAEVGGSKVAAGLGGGSDDTISFTDDRTVADGIARSLHEVRRAVTMPGDELMAELEARSGDWWPDVLDSARSVHGIRDVPETIEQRYNLFRSYAAYRERKEGILDPLFFNVDPNRLAAMDPAEIGVVSVAPAVAGAKGYRVSALGEWRIPTGRAVTIAATEYEEDRGGFSVRVVQQFHLKGTEHDHDQQTHAGGRAPAEGLAEFGFDPNQPRVPAGNPTGGEWSDDPTHNTTGWTPKTANARSVAAGPIRWDGLDADYFRDRIDKIVGPRLLAEYEACQAWIDAGKPKWDYNGPGGTSAMQNWGWVQGKTRLSDIDLDTPKNVWALLHPDDPTAKARITRWAKQWADNVRVEGWSSGQDDSGAAYYEGQRRRFTEAIQEASGLPVVRAAVARYGPVPFVAVATDAINGASARYDPYTESIKVAPLLSERIIADPDLTGAGFGVEDSASATIRHEYGHHVHFAAEQAAPTVISRFREAWVAMNGSDREINWDRDFGSIDFDTLTTPGLSKYARTNWMEGFAETFVKISHPDYDPEATPPGPVRDMERAILDLLELP